MRENLHLTTINDNIPDYAETRKEFFDLFPLLSKIGGVNYAALTPFIGIPYEPHKILALYLCGLAYGRVSELSEKGVGCWDVFSAWALVQQDLTAILPDVPSLPAPIEMEVKAPGC